MTDTAHHIAPQASKRKPRSTERRHRSPHGTGLWVTDTEIVQELGVPKAVFNMDSRAGAISEATDAGADLEHVRHAATHSNIATTQRYSRGGAEKTVIVMQKRSEHRNKSRT